MKLLKFYALCLIGMLCSFSAWAYDFQVDGIYYKITSLDSLEVEVTEGDEEYSGDIVLPDAVDFKGKQFKVSAVGESAFSNCHNLKSIDLGNVQKVGLFAFASCTGLTSIDLGRVQTISNWSFSRCSALTFIDFGNVQVIEGYAFYGCFALTTIDFKNVHKIEYAAFEGCTSMSCIDLKNVQNIEGQVFKDCVALATIKTSSMVPPSLDSKAFDQVTFLNATLKVPAGTKGIYQNTDEWKNFLSVVESAAVDQLPFFISCSEGGRVDFDNYTVSNSWTSESFNKGARIMMKFSPADGYVLKSVVVNEKDVTAEVVDNRYTVTMDVKTDVVVTFEKLPIYLTIQQADNGNTKLLIEEGKSCQIVVNPSSGWKINTVTFNDQDVTNELDAAHKYTTPVISGNAILNVTFELETPSAVQEFSASDVVVRGYKGNIVVEGVARGDEIKVYTIDGSMIASNISNGSNVLIGVEVRQVYVIKVGQRTFKLSL